MAEIYEWTIGLTLRNQEGLGIIIVSIGTTSLTMATRHHGLQAPPISVEMMKSTSRHTLIQQNFLPIIIDPLLGIDIIGVVKFV